MGNQCVVLATPDDGGPERPVGVIREERLAKRVCRALELGPTGYREARYLRFDDLWTQLMVGLDEGLAAVDKEKSPPWRTRKTVKADRPTTRNWKWTKVTGDASGATK